MIKSESTQTKPHAPVLPTPATPQYIILDRPWVVEKPQPSGNSDSRVKMEDHRGR
jgi:hypothetical protein